MSLSSPGVPMPIVTGQAYISSMAADAQRLYWLTVGSAFDNGAGSVVRCDIGSCGTTVTTLFEYLDIPQHVAVDGSYLDWSSWGNGATPNSGIWWAPKPP